MGTPTLLVSHVVRPRVAKVAVPSWSEGGVGVFHFHHFEVRYFDTSNVGYVPHRVILRVLLTFGVCCEIGEPLEYLC